MIDHGVLICELTVQFDIHGSKFWIGSQYRCTDIHIFLPGIGNLLKEFIYREIGSGIVGNQGFIVGFSIFIIAQTPIIPATAEQFCKAGNHFRIGGNDMLRNYLLIFCNILFLFTVAQIQCVQAVGKCG